MKRRAVILVNVGTPDSPSLKDVRKYLSEFLNDPKVIDMPWVFRKLLVSMIIVPFRSPRSAKLYERLWTGEGSPLMRHMLNLVSNTQALVQYGQGKDQSENLYFDQGLSHETETLDFYGAMRYGNPSLASVLEQVRQKRYDRITVLPLYPQYASSTTGSVIDMINRVSGKWNLKPEIKIVTQFYNFQVFIKPMADRIREAGKGGFDRLVFSYHGLPVNQVQQGHPSCNPDTCSCDEHMPEHGGLCYRAACYETSRLLARELGIEREKYVTAFQSRFSRNWLRPFTDETLLSLARVGAQRVVIAAPSFAADCLETTVEIGEEYRKLFLAAGGRDLVVVPCLNDALDVSGILAGPFSGLKV